MKITKTHLAKIIKEELAAVTTEGWGSGTSGTLMTTEDAYKLGEEDAEAGKAPAYPKSRHYMAGFEDKSDELESMPLQEKKGKITKSHLAQLVKEELASVIREGEYKRDDEDAEARAARWAEEKRRKWRGDDELDESLAPYGGLEDYALEALSSLGGEQPESDIAAAAKDEWGRNEWNPEDGMVDEEEWDSSIGVAMDNLVSQGRVRLTQGGAGSTDEDFYALA